MLFLKTVLPKINLPKLENLNVGGNMITSLDPFMDLEFQMSPKILNVSHNLLESQPFFNSNIFDGLELPHFFSRLELVDCRFNKKIKGCKLDSRKGDLSSYGVIFLMGYNKVHKDHDTYPQTIPTFPKDINNR